ncbi:DUF2489 domain-containing protein [Celerinatantimonas yamalensis]|uniref:DUF2489 domain-containing protein n=1 Tax=Celerinatantimonas yamalensis TaxID=559956 RepID=A0ABW9GAK6_9GAMM
MIVWAIIGVIIIAGLLGYWLYLLRLINARQQLQHQQRKQTLDMHRDRIAQSVETIAKACFAEQCESSEAAIRITQLLLAYPEQPARDWSKQYPGLFGLYQAIADLPTHQARMSQSKRERRTQDVYRLEQEKQFAAQVRGELEDLSEFFTAGAKR